MIRSQIIMGEAVENTDRRFGSAQRYYPAYIRRAGQWEPAFFSYDQLNDAILRAKNNPEDVAPRSSIFTRFIQWLTA